MGKYKYISLSVEEKKELEAGYTHGSKKHFRTRCHALLLSNSGYTVAALSELFSVRTRTIYDWFKQWNKDGIRGLCIAQGRGRKPVLTSDDKELEAKILASLSRNRQRIDIVCEEISDYLNEKVSKGMMQYYLKKENLCGKDLERS